MKMLFILTIVLVSNYCAAQDAMGTLNRSDKQANLKVVGLMLRADAPSFWKANLSFEKNASSLSGISIPIVVDQSVSQTLEGCTITATLRADGPHVTRVELVQTDGHCENIAAGHSVSGEYSGKIN